MNRALAVTLLVTFLLVTASLPAVAGDPRTDRLVETARRPAPLAMDVEMIVRYPKGKRSREEMVRDAGRGFDDLMKITGLEP